ncbi:MAG: septation regulator SpoVG [Candidatus Stahlbacteria bacterium]|nr:MAG: septation regulator SpoVG [Candidatus Stahlbacteria bacterium]
MDITEVRVTLREEPRLKAFVNVTFDNDFVVRGMKVIEGKNGLFVAMPSRRSKDGTFRDIAHPINNEMRKRLEDVVLEEYHKKCKETGKIPAAAPVEQEDFEVPEEVINADIAVRDDEEPEEVINADIASRGDEEPKEVVEADIASGDDEEPEEVIEADIAEREDEDEGEEGKEEETPI